jgi:hypothetical protein
MKKGTWKDLFIISAVVGLAAMWEHNDNKVKELESRLEEESVENMDIDDLGELMQSRMEEEDAENDYSET